MFRGQFNKKQVREALLSPMTWIYMMMGLCITLTTPIMKFSASVINGFGYSKLHTMLVGMPAGTCNTATGWIGALVPRMFPGTRTYTAIGLCFVPLLGAVLLMSLPREGAEWGIVVSTWLGGCSSALLSSSASIIASNVKGNTKKSIDAPRYTKGCILSLSSMIGLIITYIVFAIVVKRKNASRDAKAADGQVQYVVEGLGGSQQAGVSTDSDLTDVQDKGFRYTI